VQRRPANAPARLVDIAKRVLTFEQKRPACRLDPPSPEVRADEIARLPARSLLEHHDLLARLRQHGGKHRAGSPRADDDDVYFLVRHDCLVTTFASGRCAACTGYRGGHSHPWS